MIWSSLGCQKWAILFDTDTQWLLTTVFHPSCFWYNHHLNNNHKWQMGQTWNTKNRQMKCINRTVVDCCRLELQGETYLSNPQLHHSSAKYSDSSWIYDERRWKQWLYRRKCSLPKVHRWLRISSEAVQSKPHDLLHLRLSEGTQYQVHNCWSWSPDVRCQSLKRASEETLTFKIGLNALPDKVPHAEAVKLWEPTYAQPMAGSTISTSSTELPSSPSDASPFNFDDAETPCLMAIIIWVQRGNTLAVNTVSTQRNVCVPLNALVLGRPYFENWKNCLSGNFSLPTVSSGRR